MPELREWIAALSSGDPEQAEAAARHLPKNTDAVLDALGTLQQNDDTVARWWAVRALAAVDDPRAGALLVEALNDEVGSVRHCAALGLRQRPHPQAIETLGALLDGEDRLLARLAGDALGAAGEEATPALLKILGEGREEARLEAARALAHIGDPRSIPALFELLDSGSAMLEHWAGAGLEKMGLGMQFFSTNQ